MGDKEPKIRSHTDKEIEKAMTELQNMDISPIPENIETYIALVSTPQRPKGYEELYANRKNPEILQALMQKEKLQSLIHIEGPNVWSHTKLALEILAKRNISQEEKRLLQQIIFHHDLGKHEVVKNEENRTQTIKTIASGKLFQTMIGHATGALDKIKKCLKANNLNEEETDFCLKIIENHMATDILQRKNPEKIIAFFTSLGKEEHEIKRGIHYLTHMLEIDSLATENVFLRENQIEYSIHNKKSEFSFEEVRNKYINAKKERITIQAREKNLQDKLDDCDTYLPIIANSIIPDNAENKSFREHPDDPKEHQPMWHEFGIITHSKKMLQQFFNRNNWLKPIKKQIDSVLQETIDGKTKEELMAISIIFHNIGKYLRTIYIKNGEREIAHPDHEQLGKNICMTNPHVQKLIQDRYHLTEKQYNYMTNCIGLHFELAKLRVNSQTIQQGYNLQYTHSDKFMRICENIRNKNPEYKTEIGVLFLCDSLAKTDITVYEKSDEKLLEKKKTMIQLLEEKKMPAELINPVMQKPINIAVAKKYLEYLYATEDDKKN